jgi:hypothetical protein
MPQRGEDVGPSAGAADRSTGEKIGERTKEPGASERDHKAADSDRHSGGKSAEREGPSDRDVRDHDRDRKSAESKEELNRKSAKTEDKDRIDRDRKSAETSDRDRMERDTDRKSAETVDKEDRDRKSAEIRDRDRMERDTDRKSAEIGDNNRMDRDRKGAKVTIDADQKQKVRTYFSEHRPTAKRVDKSRVSVSIGAPLPTGIALAPLPSDVVVVAADCPLQYFLWGDDVVLVDSCSREVVDIIPNLG